MTLTDITNQRLYNQHLVEDMESPLDVAHWLGAVQAQDFAGAKWALGLRANTTDEEVTQLFNEGKILRTHILRPTWHFVLPEDILWIQELTRPRVHAFNKYYYKKMGIDETVARKANHALAQALRGGNYLTRSEIAEVYRAAGVLDPSGLRLGYLLIHAELEALVCSGPLKGKQHTYALLEERAPQAKVLPRDEALKELTRRYFSSRGPAQLRDFAWWSSLAVADCKKGVELAELKSREIEGKIYYFTDWAKVSARPPAAHLLPNYDEYFIAYKDRSAFSVQEAFIVTREPSKEDLWYHLLAIDGQLAGGWKRDLRKNELVVGLKLFIELNASQERALQKASRRLSDFARLPVQIKRA